METSYLHGLDDVELAIKFTLFFKTTTKKKNNRGQHSDTGRP